jgi:cytochrome c peroxidase
MHKSTVSRFVVFAALPLLCASSFGVPSQPTRAASTSPNRRPSRIARAEEPDLAEVAIGERLFLETRFAQYFFANGGADVNAPLAVGDPVMDTTITLGQPFAGPFAGMSMNCSACHLVDQQNESIGGGNRTYADFAQRSPIPARNDGQTVTPRNSPPLVNASLARSGAFFLHFDGEFTSREDLVKATITGRNYGWLPSEQKTAIANVARVIKGDDGTGVIAAEFGAVPYSVLLLGTDPNIPAEFVLPAEFRIDVSRASNKRILDAVAKLIGAYLDGLLFIQDEEGRFTSSPYDVFLIKNDLPRAPNSGESEAAYAARLRTAVDALQDPQFVSELDGHFTTHAQPFVFDALELHGLKIFLRQSATPAPAVGNCVACHAPPSFTDFKFHNTGATQEEYDDVHGPGAFNALSIPTLKARKADFNSFLPPTANHPNARGPFLSVPTEGDATRADLGLWNVFANPDMPRPQSALKALLGAEGAAANKELLNRSVARFKTPGLRDLGQSAPYLHTGRMGLLEDVIHFYIGSSNGARAGQLRNPAPELSNVHIAEVDVAPLAAFLRSLNEDYE